MKMVLNKMRAYTGNMVDTEREKNISVTAGVDIQPFFAQTHKKWNPENGKDFLQPKWKH